MTPREQALAAYRELGDALGTSPALRAYGFDALVEAEGEARQPIEQPPPTPTPTPCSVCSRLQAAARAAGFCDATRCPACREGDQQR